MEKIVSSFKQLELKDLTYEQLGKLVKSLDLQQIDFQKQTPPIEHPNNYSRNILLLEPLEIVILHWPPEVESAVHFHEGFWGYVMVLEGTCDNVIYEHEGDKLYERQTIRAISGGIIDEPDGTIHKIVNPSATENLITLHFYYPALETLDGLVLYNTEKGQIGKLNEKAKTASFLEPQEHFHEFQENAFEFVSLKQQATKKSHQIFPIIPKPQSDQIKEMISQYYGEQATQYDIFDFNFESRKKFITCINRLVVENLDQKKEVDHVLAIACGTGRRAVNIREASKHEYRITCVDLSEDMVCQASERGVDTCPGDWLEVEVPSKAFDAITFLYAFGHVPDKKQRKEAIQKMYDKLKPGGVLLMDLFNANDENEWGPQAISTYEAFQLGNYGYDKGDVFYRKTGNAEIAFLHYFDEEKICQTLEEVGFEVNFVQHVGYSKNPGELLCNTEDQGVLFLKATKPV